MFCGGLSKHGYIETGYLIYLKNFFSKPTQDAEREIYKLQGGGGKGNKSGKGSKSAGGGGGEDMDDIKRDLDSILGRGSGGTIGVPSLVLLCPTFPLFRIQVLCCEGRSDMM